MNEHPWAMALLLDKRRPKARNVLIGSDEVVVKALERKFNIDIQPYDLESPKVFSIVELESAVPLEDHASLAFWRNPPISRNELLLNYIVNVLGPEIKDKTKIVKSLMYDSESSRDFDVLYWKVIAAIKSTKVLVWDKQPWEAPDNWIGTDPDSRLAKLYHDLRAYAYVLEDNRGELKTLGISSGKITYLSGLKLSINKIIETLSVLSQWRFKKLSGHQATFIISTVWSRK